LDLDRELLQRRVIWFELEAAVDSILSLGEFIESEESGCRAVVSFYIGRVETEGRRRVNSGGAVVF
jgi:hypothetical protein